MIIRCPALCAIHTHSSHLQLKFQGNVCHDVLHSNSNCYIQLLFIISRALDSRFYLPMLSRCKCIARWILLMCVMICSFDQIRLTLRFVYSFSVDLLKISCGVTSHVLYHSNNRTVFSNQFCGFIFYF